MEARRAPLSGLAYRAVCPLGLSVSPPRSKEQPCLQDNRLGHQVVSPGSLGEVSSKPLRQAVSFCFSDTCPRGPGGKCKCFLTPLPQHPTAQDSGCPPPTQGPKVTPILRLPSSPITKHYHICLQNTLECTTAPPPCRSHGVPPSMSLALLSRAHSWESSAQAVMMTF